MEPGPAVESSEGEAPKAAERLPTRVKAIYGLGDHTINLALSSLAFLYPFFLTDVAGLRPALAGLIPLAGRAVDAFSDPAMGRLSDVTSLRAGRRRPYFLIGMLPFGLTFAALWWNLPADGQAARFGFYTTAYVLFSLATTVLAVPYLALLPELTSDYQERTSLNVFRGGLAISGTIVAVMVMRPLAAAFGGGGAGWQAAGTVAAVWIVLPWVWIYRVTFERPEFQRPSEHSFLQGIRLLTRHGTYMRLMSLYLLGRIAIDLATAMFLYYFTYWLGRPDDFGPTMGLFLVMVIVALPFWLRVSRHVDKRVVFLFGAAWWVCSQGFLLAAQPDWPRSVIFLAAAVAAIGYAVADMMPWSMLGDVVDEDELVSGERREGLYFGFFTFLRKLGGAGGVALALFALDLSGFQAGREQSETTLRTIRILTAAVPAVFIALGAWVALGYPLGRARHEEILEQLRRQRAERGA